jgi:hypothetical protein
LEEGKTRAIDERKQHSKHRTQNTKPRISMMNLQLIEKIMKFLYREINHPLHPHHFASLLAPMPSSVMSKSNMENGKWLCPRPRSHSKRLCIAMMGENQCASQSSSESSNPKTLKLKTSGF